MHFVEFVEKDKILRWQSIAQGKDKEFLKEYGKIIRTLVYSIFGDNTHIEQVSADDSIQAKQDSSPNLSHNETNISYSQHNIESTTQNNTPNVLESHISSNSTESINSTTASSPNDRQEKQDFLAQNHDLIMALNKSVGIKEVRERSNNE